MMLPYILNLIGNKKMWVILIFWCFIVVMIELPKEIKSNILWLTRSKIMALTSEREIAVDNGMWLTCLTIWNRYKIVKKGLSKKFLLENYSKDIELLKFVKFCG